MLTVFDVKGVGPTMGTGLTKKGIATAEQLANAEVAELLTVSGIGQARACRLIEAAKASLIPAPVSDFAGAPVTAPAPDAPTAAAGASPVPKMAKAKPDILATPDDLAANTANKPAGKSNNRKQKK